MEPIIKNISDKILVGMQTEMSIVNNQTFKLFKTFMPRKKEIMNIVDDNVYDLRIYPANYYEVFDPQAQFIKWAAAEVSDNNDIPTDMETFHLQGGQYAVFHYKGLNSDPSIFQYIFTEWLPQSGYTLDYRPHFEIMGPKTKLNDSNSEEEIWIPIK
ncbi:MAG: GyrI-like domain-containing protein [Saprospiraceae bacterium]|nr:GyrI-like domain-containing protein [Bacteroidia bacterium]NNL90600.1 GyrI-like domain-containing protein [Saprospiraceae bacterium]